MKALEPGDMCWVQRPFKRHYGIYVGPNSEGTPVFVHNVPESGVVRATKNAFARGQPIHLEHRPHSDKQRLVVQRAQSLVGRPYNALSSNCEHAASFAATGIAESPQVQRTVLAFAAFGGLALLLNHNGTFVDSQGYRRDRSGRFATRRWR